MMIVSALTTVIAIAAVTGAIGYRFFTGGQRAIGTDGTIALPKGARVDFDVRLGRPHRRLVRSQWDERAAHLRYSHAAGDRAAALYPEQ